MSGNFLLQIFLLIIGFYGLIKGADVLISGAMSLAKKWGVSTFVIGLTIVSFGTSAPEFFIGIISSLRGANEITFGNVLGSNIANILLALGLAATITPIAIQKSTAWKEIPFMVLAHFLLLVVVSDRFFDNAFAPFISRSESFILLSLFCIFMVYSTTLAKEEHANEDIAVYSLSKSFLLFGIGLLGLSIGGSLVVGSATYFAKLLGMSASLIGITVVALGTSLPEIITTIRAAQKKSVELGIGNIIGSNIFNIFWILAVSGIIHPIQLHASLEIDTFFNFLISLLLLLFFHINREEKKEKSFLLLSKKFSITRGEGLILVLLYVGYTVFLFSR
jgi:cation:H+ antiporter